jgi:hypothetical protein
MWYIILFVAGIIAGAVGGYLVGRNNPKVLAKVNETVNKIDPGA